MSMTNLWPFTFWGIDLIGRFHKGRGSVQYAVVAIDYFTKWIETKAFVSIMPSKIKEFVYKNVICGNGVSHTIILDNGTKFDCDEFKEFYDVLQIKKVLSLVARP